MNWNTEADALDREHPGIAKVVANVEKVMIGKREPIQMCLVALLCGGHVLLEDVPGVGKTMLVRALARSVGCGFSRIQFTPDLLPSDVTGVSVFNQQTSQFEFRPGPVMSQVVLADEINRTSPKTQAALLEALEEGSVTVDGDTYELEKPFFVMATQNPIEYEGTFPLPEAQLDRFLLKLKLGYPDHREEMEMLDRIREHHPIDDLGEVLSREELINLQREVRRVRVDPSISDYIVRIVRATRNPEEVYLGASPRGSIALYQTAQALAWVRGRPYVIPDDVKKLVPLTLSHRIILKSEARLSGRSVEQLLQELLRRIPVPVSVGD
ncbi:AAA family ATPase [Kroppenstedtia eburnea]|uniref:MoxR-like ATPase n=1 Tax=Kroppenstedtia eburnea TaxID=714067 RepID=A0A1N7PWA3_9BACL|nr:MoxR family ATPase [Kroppenstedtia eburnea]EGK09199.1 methanol dehydrogenase regulatory protein [Desmospora sp. 8437]SIT14709.1 MoxR-like ATPase [Kroppenstedtia eburnea]